MNKKFVAGMLVGFPLGVATFVAWVFYYELKTGGTIG